MDWTAELKHMNEMGSISGPHSVVGRNAPTENPPTFIFDFL